MTSTSQNLTLCFARGSSQPIIATSTKPTHIPENHILICVDRFGLSANNITYQALGEHPHFRYFDFHPAPNEGGISPKTHGVVPVWGFGTVVASSHPKVLVGERLYGYLAPTRYLLVEIDPKDANKHAIYVPRSHFPPDRRPYNQILRCSTDPAYTQDTEDLIMLYRPLFWTSFWCEDWLHSSGYQTDCSSILISSASSKTAFCFAYCVSKRYTNPSKSSSSTGNKVKPKLIGITSSKNLSFTKQLGLYDEVYTYDEFTSVPALQGSRVDPKKTKWIYVDVAGNDKLNESVYKHFESPYTGKLVLSVSLGMTTLTPASMGAAVAETMGAESGHGAGAGASSAKGLVVSNSGTYMNSPSQNAAASGVSTATTGSTEEIYPKIEKFFTPEWLEIRRKQIPVQEIFEMQKKAWTELMRDCRAWVRTERVYNGVGGTGHGERVKEEYEKIEKEGMKPDMGMIWSMWGGEGEAERVCVEAGGVGTKAKL
ncbi:hypothetical protein K435DRAFT_971258 [Dendrothele bispora CBS 962.96]|uniref:Uncharacterized protein n=1 Tax=Dendrothele bispora (strain CBS 962.96) TaxID=1314807 RepID=A0A4S8L6Y6_DENBC|nr:hypothetical protein K435DRAFT_971258 [Dendrothele bispora CBS 962.96]